MCYFCDDPLQLRPKLWSCMFSNYGLFCPTLLNVWRLHIAGWWSTITVLVLMKLLGGIRITTMNSTLLCCTLISNLEETSVKFMASSYNEFSGWYPEKNSLHSVAVKAPDHTRSSLHLLVTFNNCVIYREFPLLNEHCYYLYCAVYIKHIDWLSSPILRLTGAVKRLAKQVRDLW